MTRERERGRRGSEEKKKKKKGGTERVRGRLGSNSRPREDYLYLGKPLEGGGCTPMVELRSCCVATRPSYRVSPPVPRKRESPRPWTFAFRIPEAWATYGTAAGFEAALARGGPPLTFLVRVVFPTDGGTSF